MVILVFFQSKIVKFLFDANFVLSVLLLKLSDKHGSLPRFLSFTGENNYWSNTLPKLKIIAVRNYSCLSLQTETLSTPDLVL